jgi:hypothetical protein
MLLRWTAHSFGHKAGLHPPTLQVRYKDEV